MGWMAGLRLARGRFQGLPQVDLGAVGTAKYKGFRDIPESENGGSALDPISG